ncbi:MASE1 domain-containing protein [Alkalinema sp. FACHB-956]|uniref:MASE1 domain-containing protein n=1 Tax=Alkalinema sp. FACHB-956 TaxID=2692768 RepID=UPI0016861F38|nr:MASE1 domain-containing protein [Alkalinema sp. FACHB-956]MBD2326604.1 MASE1 domain-containing protein [Alkalinema sp. FACHB-956]
MSPAAPSFAPVMRQLKFPGLSRVLIKLGSIVALAIAYYATAELSRYLASTPQDVTPVWPPDGLAVAAVLVFGNWLAYGVGLGSFLANFWAFRDTTSLAALLMSTLPVIGIAIGTTLGTLLGSWLLRKATKGRYPLERVTDVFRFLFLTGMAGPSVNATVGVTCLMLSGKVPWPAYGTVWLIWWISNVSGIWIVTPILLSWKNLLQNSQSPFQHPLQQLRQWLFPPLNSDPSQSSLPPQAFFAKLRWLSFWRTMEPAVLLGLIAGIGGVAFDRGYHFEFMLIPLLIWAAFRLGQPGATLFTGVVTAIAVIATVNGKGGFVRADLNYSLMQLQAFIGVITLTILVLTATIAERARAEAKLRVAFDQLAETNETLEIRVQERTEELYLKNETLQQTLTKLQQTQLQMLQSEKMSALGQMVAGIAHEINNPVNFIHGNLTYIERYVKDLLQVIEAYQLHYPQPPQTLQILLDEVHFTFLQADLIKLLQSMNVGTDRIRQIILSLRNFSRLDEADFKAVNLHEGLENTLLILQHRFIGKHNRPDIEIVKHYGDLPLVECYPSQINQVFMNLLVNAIDALEEPIAQSANDHEKPHLRRIWIATRAIANDRIQVEIVDNGVGIPEDVKSRIFDPFFTTKPVGKGTGLGLSISYQIITEKHQGQLWCSSTPGRGTKFMIEIPVHQYPRTNLEKY